MILKSYTPEILLKGAPKELLESSKIMPVYFVTAGNKNNNFPQSFRGSKIVFSRKTIIDNKNYFYNVYLLNNNFGD